MWQHDVDLAATAAAIADAARANMLLRLMDGQAHSASELAASAGIKPSAATAHLHRLRDAGLVVAQTDGRRRLHRLSSPAVAHAIEALAQASPLLPGVDTARLRAGSSLRFARACYSHLGGTLAVSVATVLQRDGVIEQLTGGRPARLQSLEHPLLAALGINRLEPGSADSARGCLDWTEQTPHLAGRLGTQLFKAMLSTAWLRRRPRDRSVAVTERGYRAFAAAGIDLVG